MLNVHTLLYITIYEMILVETLKHVICKPRMYESFCFFIAHTISVSSLELSAEELQFTYISWIENEGDGEEPKVSRMRRSGVVRSCLFRCRETIDV